tara:strand:- start:3942 stop:4436 length:495 start_codon:yes stop_codon:yes gene_type:complete
MVKINEFNDMDIPKEIVPKPDYDVPSDLLIFMRNDPMFYRKNFFPAVEKYRENKKDTSMLEKMCETGLIEYCKKFNIENTKDELLGDGDMKALVAEIIADEMADLNEGIMHMLRRWFTGDPQAKSWLEKYNVDPKAAEAMVGSEVHQQYLNRYIGIQKADKAAA